MKNLTAKSIYYLTLFLLVAVNANGQTKLFTGTGLWNDASKWSPIGVPAATDNVLIAPGANITVSTDATCDSIYFQSGASGSTITINGGIKLTSTKGILFSNPTANVTQLISVGAGSLECGELNLPNLTTGRINRVSATTGTIQVNLNVTLAGSNTENIIEFSGAGKFRIGGTCTLGTGTFTNSTSSFEYFSASTQTIFSRTYNKLILSGGVKNPSGTVTCNDSVIVNTGATLNNSGTANLAFNGVFYIAGTYIEGSTSGSVTLTGLTHIASTGTFQVNVAEIFAIRGGIKNEGTFISGTGTYTFATNNQELSGNKMFTFSGGVTVTGITLTASDSVRINGTFQGTGTYVNQSYLLLMGATNTITTLDLSSIGNTVEYGAAGTQTVKGASYKNLRITGSGTKTANANITVNNLLFIDASPTLAMSTFLLSLDPGCLTTGTGNLSTANVTSTPIPADKTWPYTTITYNSASAQTIVSGTYNNLTSSSVARTLSSSGAIVINGLFTPGTGAYTSTGSIVQFNSGSTQTITGITGGYNKLILNGGVKNPSGTLICNDSLIVNSGATLNNSGSANLTFNGVFYIAGTYIEGSTSGAVTLVGLTHITPTGTFQVNVAEIFAIRGGIKNEGTFISGAGTYTFANNNQELSGNKLFVFSGGVTVTGITLTASDSVRINGTFQGTGTYLNKSYLLLMGATNSITNLDLSSTGNTVEYGAAGNQTVKGSSYKNLRITGSGTKTSNANIAVGDELYIDASPTLAMSTFLLSLDPGCLTTGTGNLSTANVTSTPIPAGKTWPYTTITYNSGSGQTIVNGTYNNLTSSNAARTLSAIDTIHIKGTFTPSTGTYTSTGSTVNFNSNSVQNIPPINGGYNRLVVTGGTTKTATSNIIINGDIRVDASTTLNMQSFTLTGASMTNTGLGTIQTNAPSGAFSNGRTWNSTIKYTSASDQSIITGTYANIELTGSGATKTVNGTITVNGNLTVGSGVLMSMITNLLTGTLTSTNGTGTLSTTNTSAAPIPANKDWTFTIRYSSASFQNVVSGNYSNLNCPGGTRVLSSSGTIKISGTYTPATANTITGSTIEFNGDGSQTIPVSTYNNLTSTNTGARTLAAGTITVIGNYTPGNNTYTTTGNTMVFSGNNQNISGTFNNLTLSTSGVTKTALNNITIDGTLNIASGVTLDMTNNYVINGALTSVVNNGVIKTGVPTITSNTPIPSNKTWGGTVEYNGNQNQTTVPGTYTNLTLSGTGVKQASGDITVNAILNLGANPNLNQGILEMTSAYGSYANVNNIDNTSIYNNLNSFILTMGGSSSTSGNGDVTGKIRRTTIVSATTYSFGNANTQLTFTGASLPTQITVVSTRGNEGMHVDKSNSVKRLYQILRTGGSSPTTMNIRLAYDDNDLNGNTESNLILWDHHLPYGGLTPHEHGKTNQNTTQNWVELTSHGILYLAAENDPNFTKYWMISNKISVDTTWLGAVSGGSWNIPSNWNTGAVPPSNAKIIIPDAGNTPFDPTISGTVTVGTMEIKTGGIVNGGSGTLILTGGPAINGGAGTWLNNGTFNPGTGTVVIDNTDGTIAGTTTFNNLTVNTTKKVTIQGSANLTFNGAVTANGILDATTNPNTITYSGTSQTIINPNGTIPGYSTLIINGVTPALASTIDISGDLTLNTTVAFTGNTTRFRGITDQIINGTNAPTFNNLIINNSGQVSATNNVTINGTLTFNTGKLNINNNTLTLAGGITNTVSEGLKSGGNASLILNGSNARTISFDQSIPNTTNRINTLTNNSSGQTTTIGNKLFITNAVIPTSGTINANGNLVLVSDNTKTARIGQGTGSYITGNVTVQRYIPESARRWRFVSSPLTNATIEDWRNEIFITGPGTGNTIGTINSNGYDATQNNAPGIYWYNETLTTGDLNSGWTIPTNTSHVLAPGRGYRLFVRGDRSDINRITNANLNQNAVTTDLTGTVNTGDITMPITFTSSGNINNDGWNLIGNPYPSPFDWKTFHESGRSGNSGTNYTNIEPTVWVLDPVENTYKFYNTLSSEGTIADGILSQSQGFWVKATGAGASITFKESFKVDDAPTQLFKSTQGGAFKIKLMRDALNADELLIKYMNGSTTNFEAYDVLKLSAPIIVSAWGNDSIHLALSTRPLTTQNDTIKLYVSGSSGSYTMQFTNSDKIAIQDQVLLFDNYTNNVIDLKQNSNYTFNINTNTPATFGFNRFYIVVANNNQLPVKLVSFNAQKTNNNLVQLNWATAIERNSSKFEVEHATDNRNFKTIGVVNAKGNSNVLTNYTLTHNDPNNINYYRLKQIDVNRTVEYSQVVMVDFNQNEEKIDDVVKMYPIPAKDLLTIELNNSRTITDIAIYNIDGILVDRIQPNNPKASINVTPLASGVYVLQIEDENGEIFKRKLVKE